MQTTLVAIGIVAAVTSYVWAWVDRRRKNRLMRHTETESAVADALTEISIATTMAEMEEIRVKYLGLRGQIRAMLNDPEVPNFVVEASRMTIQNAWETRVARINSGPVPTLPIEHLKPE